MKTNAATGSRIEDVQFQGSSNHIFEGAGAALVALPRDGMTDANGELHITGLVPGIYWVREINPANFYDIDRTDVRNVTVVFSRTATVAFKNYPIGKVKLTKMDTADETKKLKGAVFAIYSDKALTTQAGINLTTGDGGMSHTFQRGISMDH